MMQNNNAHSAFEESQKMSLLRLSDIPRHVVEQHYVEVRRDGAVIDGASVGRLVTALFHFPFHPVLENIPETLLELMAARHDQQTNGRGATSHAGRSSDEQ